jgi:propionate CoA-transferase
MRPCRRLPPGPPSWSPDRTGPDPRHHADEAGNLTLEHEGVIVDVLGAAQAARRWGGTVIAQVKRLASVGSLDPRLVRVPSNLVDAIVVVPE